MKKEIIPLKLGLTMSVENLISNNAITLTPLQIKLIVDKINEVIEFLNGKNVEI